MVADLFTVLKMTNNDNFQVYARPRALGEPVTAVKTGGLTFSN